MSPLARGAAWLSLLREGMTTMKSTIYATVSALALLAAAPALGQNVSNVTQTGTTGAATVDQTGTTGSNLSDITQAGDSNSAAVTQASVAGAQNHSTVTQAAGSTGNHATV